MTQQNKHSTLFDLSQNPKRYTDFWNIVKGIGIISVVAGHTTCPLVEFVYLYHLSIFFFISGYFYHKKYTFKTFLSKKIKSLWWPFVYYNLIFILLHNTFNNLHLQYERHYTFESLIKVIIKSLGFYNSELLLAPSWFLVTLFFSLILFDLIRRTIEYIHLNETKTETIIYIIFFPVLSYLLILHYNSDLDLIAKIERAFLILPILYAGKIINLYKNKIKLSFPLFIISALALVLLTIFGIRIEISKSILPLFPLFYIISFIGIYFVLCLSEYCLRSKYLTAILTICGKYSLHIMLLHLLAFKLINLLDVYINSKPIETLAAFTISNSDYWVLYSVTGIMVPIGIVASSKYLWRKLRSVK